MKRSINIVFLITLLLGNILAVGQNVSNKGKEFWVGYGHHQFMENGSNTQNMVLYLSAEEQPATVTVTIDSSGVGSIPSSWWRRTYNIPAYTVINIEDPATPAASFTAQAGAFGPIPKNTNGQYDARLYTDPWPAGTGGAGIFRKKGIHIQSNVPIVAYAHIYGSASSGATMLLPVTAWGYTYTSVNSKQEYASDCYNWTYIIASKDSSYVQITPSVLTRSQNVTGLQPGVTTTIMLMKGQIYQIIGANIASDANGNGGGSSSGRELTGTVIRSVSGAGGECYPIAVFAGSSRTHNPMSSCGSNSGGDNDNQQEFPQHAWGKRYLTAPFAGYFTPVAAGYSFGNSTYKIAVRDPTTVVKRNGIVISGLQNGNFYVYESSTADYIEADKPIMVVQFMTGGTCLGSGGANPLGDPEMVVLSPIEQAIKRVGFYRNTLESINVNYLNLIVPTAGVSSLLIDGSNIFTYTYPHPQLPGYTIVIKRWFPSSKSQVIVSCDSSFNGITYGLGSVESYAYNAGAFLNNLNAVTGLHNIPDTTNGGINNNPFNCINTPVKISALMRYQPQKLEWTLSALGTVVSPNADFTMNPASNYYVDSLLVNGINYYRYTLPGTYVFNTAGSYDIPLRSTSLTIDNCNNHEDLILTVIIKPAPVADFNITRASDCAKDTIYFTNPVATNGYTIGQYLWTLPGAVTATTTNTKLLIGAGTYSATLYIASTEGCSSSLNKPFTVAAAPIASVVANPPAVCIGLPITLSSTSTYTGVSPLINKWYWDLGNGTILNNVNGNPVTVSYSTPNTYVVKHVVSVSQLCVSDTATLNIIVSPQARTAVTYPSGCIPASGLASFSTPLTDLGGQAITSWLWNFGDPNANAGNPNTSTIRTPTHTYTAFGNYTVHLHIVTAQCIGDTDINIAMNLIPTLSFGALNPVCENSAPVSVAQGANTNNVPGVGIYRGPGTTSAGIFNPTVAGYGTKTIWFIYTSNTGGCIDSVSQTILVRARPRPSFTYPNGTCLPTTGLVAFNNTTSIPDGQATNYVWDFNDPNANAGNPNTSNLPNPTHNFKEGTYNVKLTATTVNGCAWDTTITMTFKVTPQTAFSALTPVCESVAGTISVANGSVLNGVTGSGVYTGTATNSAGQFTPSQAGYGTFTITYTYTTTGGCTASSSQTILVRAKPRPNFTFSATNCLPTTGFVQFTNTSTIPDGQAMTWSWDFNDPNANAGNPNNSSALNPSHNFRESTYNISLQVTTPNGCVADTALIGVFKVTPALTWPALATVCQSTIGSVSVATASVSNNVTGNGVYSGPATDATGNFTPSAAGPGTFTLTYTFTSTGGCTATLTRTITVVPKPNVLFSFPVGTCLPTTGLVNFVNSSTVAGGGVLTYTWDFNDPNANAGNPNTSTLTNPSHNFREGTYNIKLTAAGSGCSWDTTITAVFKVTPQLNYPPLQNVCQSFVGTVSVGTATVLNNVTGSGSYSGPGTDATGNFSPSVAGFGTHTITYSYTTTGGCTATISQAISVTPAPVPNFTFPVGTCLPTTGLVQFTNTTFVPGGGTLNYVWDFNDPNANAGNPNTSNAANPTHIFKEGTYNIKLSASAVGCSKDTTITAVFKVTPQLNYPPLQNVCQSFVGTVSVGTATVLNNVTGTGSYSGPGTDATGNFSPSVAGFGTHTITYSYTTTGGCTATISQAISVTPAPVPNFSFPVGTCLPTTGLVQFTNTTFVPGGGTLNYVWDFNDPNANAGNPNTSNAANPTHIFKEGTYNIKLSASAVGCSKDTTIVAIFKVTPQLTFNALNPVCENIAGTISVASATVVNGVTGSGTYSGSGPGLDAAGNFTPSLAGFGTYTVTYTFVTTGGCTASVSSTILVRAKPIVSFTYPLGGCLPANGTVQFTNTTTIGDGQTLNYLWNFGDPNANAGNPNTSLLINPSHNFTEGLYNIQLVATTPNGCTGNTTIAANLKVTPQLAFSALQPVCESVVGTVSVANGTVLNGVVGTGVYSGPGTDAAGNFSPSLAGYGTKTITYTYTSTGGCAATVTQTIFVRARPRTNFTYPLTGCLPGNGTVQFTNSTTIPDGQTLSYLWNFGDPFANGGNPNTSTLINPSHNFTEGTFNIKLTANTPNGCTFDTTVIAALKVTPVLAYGTIPSICQSAAPVSVANGSVLNNVTGTGTYSGPGTNAAGMFDPNAAGSGTHVITYTYTSTGGCTATSTQTIKVHPKPVGIFNLNNNSICLNQSVTITNASTITTGNITNWNWDFGDLSNASKTNGAAFTHTYSTFGSYDIKLIATSDSGCISTPVTQTIGVHALPNPNFTLPSGVCMPNGTATFNNLSTIADAAALSYSWDFGDGSTSSATIGSHVYGSSNPVQVTLLATSSFGCSQNVVKTFSAFFDKPVANGNISPSVLCQGVVSQFTDLSTAQNSSIKSWMWIFGDGSMSNVQSPAKKYLLPGTYNVKLIVTNQADCISDTFAKTVIVNLQPVIDAGPSFIVPLGSLIQFQPTAKDSAVLSFLWTPAGDFADATLLRPSLLALRDQTYTLLATGAGNCIATDQITVKILKPVKVPNAFSPNGDGINDTWNLANLIDYPGAGVEVFNRYGQVVYSVSTYSNPWDGTYNGRPLPFGVYYYVITLRNGFKPLTGSVTIIR